MDVERTMEFIVDTLATLVARQDKAEIRADRMDRRMHGLQTLVKTGMRMMVKLQLGHERIQRELAGLAAAQKRTEEAIAELAASHKELAAAQKRTDQRFDRWLDSLNKSRNGSKRRPN